MEFILLLFVLFFVFIGGGYWIGKSVGKLIVRILFGKDEEEVKKIFPVERRGSLMFAILKYNLLTGFLFY